MFIFLLSCLIWFAESRCVIDIRGSEIGDVRFEQIRDAHSLSGRPAFKSIDSDLYLYHSVGEHNFKTFGRWVIADQLWLNESAVQFVDSWAVTPCEISAINDNPGKPNPVGWMVTNEQREWIIDENFAMQCYSDIDNVIYFDSIRNLYLTGYFVKMVSDYGDNIYVKIKRTDDEATNFLFKYDTKWLIGSDPTVDNAIAFCDADVATPQQIKQKWHFLAEDETWIEDYADLLVRSDDMDIVDILRSYRSFDRFPEEQEGVDGLFTMRNGLQVPVVGFGTGGIPPEQVVDATISALNVGYRLIDSSREYQNEVALRSIFWHHIHDELFPTFDEVFFISKVWPTELGFAATSNAIYHSRINLGLPSISNYMLHWPACYKDVEWMHCDQVADPHGDWLDSYTALEKAYAEGDIMSIGLSNFDRQLLQSVASIANVLPHIVQNYGTVGHLDMDVRYWCAQFGVAYMAYASARNVKELPADLKRTIQDIAAKYGMTPHSVVYKFMLQTHALIIPRSTNEEHIYQNLQALNWMLTDEEMESLGYRPF